MTLAERLKIARNSLGATQNEIAINVSVSVQMWRAYESGKSVPGGNVLEALARLGFNVNWLLTGEGEMKYWEFERKIPRRYADELWVNVIQAALESAGVEDYKSGEYAHTAIDIIGLVAELRDDLPTIDEIKSMFSVIIMLNKHLEQGLSKFNREDIPKLIELAIKGRTIKDKQ